ncbi:MAG TPA: hypothetical protein VFO40_10890, partial [Chthoniobacterales bacterium]|nr:hypothetical protein [Chthoniobacterales bacterium]
YDFVKSVSGCGYPCPLAVNAGFEPSGEIPLAQSNFIAGRAGAPDYAQGYVAPYLPEGGSL